ARVAQIADAVGDGIVRRLEDVGEELYVVASALNLFEEVAIRQQECAGEKIRQMDFENLRRLGVPRLQVACEFVVQSPLVEKAQTGGVRELKLQTMFEERSRDLEDVGLEVVAANDGRALARGVDELHAEVELFLQ